jgi:hypothetical protein
VHRIAARFPEQFAISTVGTTIELCPPRQYGLRVVSGHSPDQRAG